MLTCFEIGPSRGLRGVSLNNSIFMIGILVLIFLFHSQLTTYASGGYTSDNNGNSLALDSILKIDAKDSPSTWTSVGKLDQGRGYHGVSVVSSSDIINDCH